MDLKENKAEQMLQEYVARERGRNVKVQLKGTDETLNRPKPRTLRFNLAKAASCAAAVAIPAIIGAMLLYNQETKVYGYVNQKPVTDKQEAIELTLQMLDELAVTDGKTAEDIFTDLFKL